MTHKSTGRRRIYDVIEVAKFGDRASNFYDTFMMIVIVASLSPLVTKNTSDVLNVIDKVTAAIFIIDYILRWSTADYKLGKGVKSFFIYPITIMAIVDLLSILPSLSVLGNAFKVLKVFRLFRTLRVFRIFKAFRYSKNIRLINNVIKNQRRSLGVVGALAVGYIIVCALVMFNAEPDTFNTFFDAV